MEDPGGPGSPGRSAPRKLPGRTASGNLGPAAQLGKGQLGLNSSNAQAAVALPVKRRGSFQQLKKAGLPGRDNLDSDSRPSIFAVVKKSTHWEKYGTVLVLLIADEFSTDKENIQQMLSAEGYDDTATDSAAEALKLFSEKEVFPDIVVIDSDNELVDTKQCIKQLQRVNPTVAIMVLGSTGGPIGSVAALQAGASDYMAKPLNLDELVARVERHVQRQHCIKLEMEKALEDANQMLQQLMPAQLLGEAMLRKDGAAAPGHKGLNSVAETDFEEQMSELSDENHRLGQKVQEMERKLEIKDRENRVLEAKLNAIDRKVAIETFGVRGQLDSVAQSNLDLKHKVDELERLMQAHHGVGLSAPHSHPTGLNSSSSQGSNPGSGRVSARVSMESKGSGSGAGPPAGMAAAVLTEG